ncbi:MAG: tRNA (5-methylaminomethyl-2-thiouridine)(34)-methyltransferase MnmD [Pirellulaceae bacterium]
MSLRNRQQIAVADHDLTVVVTDDSSRTLKCLRTGVTWHSESGALAESRLVFLENSGIAGILSRKQSARVYETGFGTGLNFWLTASAAIRNDALLEYVSCETRFLSGDVIGLLEHGKLDQCQPAFDMFANPIFGRASIAPDSDSALRVQYSCAQLTVVNPHQHSVDSLEADSFDAIYHDPFGPGDAPDLWTAELFQKMHALLKPGGRLVTYCVKSAIQRRLTSVGFEVGKTRGPEGGKREVLIAEKLA